MNSLINNKVYFQDWKMVDYQDGLNRQLSFFNNIIDKKIENRKLDPSSRTPTDNFLFFCEHNHVYTLGKSGSKDHLLISEKEMESRDIAYYEIGRGGDITYHGPGQIVGYPVLDLENFNTDIHKYMRNLEEVIIRTLQHYDLEGGRYTGFTGVWLGNEKENNWRKICAFGVKLSRWVSMHGFSLNVNTNLSFFDNIVPCGIDDKAVTSMQKELGHIFNMEEVKSQLLKNFADVFKMDIIQTEY